VLGAHCSPCPFTQNFSGEISRAPIPPAERQHPFYPTGSRNIGPPPPENFPGDFSRIRMPTSARCVEIAPGPRREAPGRIFNPCWKEGFVGLSGGQGSSDHPRGGASGASWDGGWGRRVPRPRDQRVLIETPRWRSQRQKMPRAGSTPSFPPGAHTYRWSEDLA